MRLPAQLLRRKPDTHKRDYGHILILAGSLGYTGAGILCAKACLRSGAGLVTLGIPQSLNCVFAKRVEELMLLPLPETKQKSLSLKALDKIKRFLKKTNCLVIGPGLSQNKTTQGLTRKIIKSYEKPIVIDADGLNAIVGHLGILKKISKRRLTAILTPHPGEMARLLNTTSARIQENRKDIAKSFAKKYNVVVILKGNKTIVTDGKTTYVNKTGNPGMATAGTGDVLSGIIGAFLGQGLDSFEAAKYATYIHGLAGDLAAREKSQMGLIATDIIEKISGAIKKSS
jgi:hydroxyethylthiazole kinase-like uncharacterized protein yjeF